LKIGSRLPKLLSNIKEQGVYFLRHSVYTVTTGWQYNGLGGVCAV